MVKGWSLRHNLDNFAWDLIIRILEENWTVTSVADEFRITKTNFFWHWIALQMTETAVYMFISGNPRITVDCMSTIYCSREMIKMKYWLTCVQDTS